MKKTKIILPILSATSLAATIIPIVTSCNSTNTNLSESKNKAMLTVSIHEMESIARQPEASSKIRATANYLVSQIQKADHYAQVLGLTYSANACDAISRQPEAAEKVSTAMMIVTNLVLTQHNGKAIALGTATDESGGIYDAIARQPEASDFIIQAYIEYADRVING